MTKHSGVECSSVVSQQYNILNLILTSNQQCCHNKVISLRVQSEEFFFFFLIFSSFGAIVLCNVEVAVVLCHSHVLLSSNNLKTQ